MTTKAETKKKVSTKSKAKKLQLTKETIRDLSPASSEQLKGGRDRSEGCSYNLGCT